MKAWLSRCAPSRAQALLLLVVVAVIISTDPSRHFTPDSWTLFELARSVFTDFYRVETIREYAFASEYSASFPPLWPVIMAVLSFVFGTETGAGLIANGLFAFATLAVFMRLAGRLYGRQWLGLLLFLLLLSNRHYIYSLRGAHSMVLYLFLIASLYWVLLENKIISWQRAGIVGAIAGLMALTRFDGLVYALALLPVVAWLSTERVKAAAAYAAAVFLLVLPWALYCHQHFGVWLASDNSRTLWAVEHVFVLDYLPGGVQMMADNPGKWVENAFRDTELFLGIAFTKLLFVPALLGLLFLAAKKAGAKFRFRKPKLRRRQFLLAVPLAAQMGLVAVSGYHEARYLLPVQMVVAFFLLGLVDWKKFSAGAWLSAYGSRVFTGLCLLIAIIYLAGTIAKKDRDLLGGFKAPNPPASFEMVTACLEGRPKAPIMLVGDRLSYRFAAYYNGKVFLEPYGIAGGWGPYYERFGIRYALLPENQAAPVAGLPVKILCRLPEWGKKRDGLALYEILAYKANP